MTATAPPTSEYLAAPNEVISAANGIDYAYRQVGEEGRRRSCSSSTSAGTSTTGIPS